MYEIDWNEKVKEALDRTEFMAISTINADGSWTCPVQFGHSEKLDLYFRSMPLSRHMRHLLADNRISVAIFKTDRFPGTREVVGLQLKGRAARLTDRANIAEAARHMYGRDPRKIDYRTKIDEHLDPHAVWNFVKISPEEAWCFDSRVFGEERCEIDLKSLNLKLGYQTANNALGDVFDHADRKRTDVAHMSAFGPQQTWTSALHMSAYGGKADMGADTTLAVLTSGLTCAVLP